MAVHLYPNPNSSVLPHVLRHYIPELLQKFPRELLNLARTHSINTFTYRLKSHIIDSYNSTCIINNCYVCNNGDNEGFYSSTWLSIAQLSNITNMTYISLHCVDILGSNYNFLWYRGDASM